jgi:hypothetical protein
MPSPTEAVGAELFLVDQRILQMCFTARNEGFDEIF